MERKILIPKTKGERGVRRYSSDLFLKRHLPLECEISNSPLKRLRQDEDSDITVPEFLHITKKKCNPPSNTETKSYATNLAASRLQSLRENLKLQQFDKTVGSLPSTSRGRDPQLKSATIKHYLPKSESVDSNKFNNLSKFNTKTNSAKPTVNSGIQYKRNDNISSKFSVQERLLKHKNETLVEDTNQHLVSDWRICNTIAAAATATTTKVADKNCVSYEEMDWEPIDEAKIIIQIKEVRKHLPREKLQLSEVTQNLLEKQKSLYVSNTGNLNIVIDTNVFISNLRVIKNLLDVKFPDKFKPSIVIPWMVIQELDFIKDGRSNNGYLKTNAQLAIKYINSLLSSRLPYIKCQTAMDAAKNDILHRPVANDDEILFCCLKHSETNDTVLLSNDINLRNKALIHNVNAYSGENVLHFIINDYKKSLQSPKALKIREELTRAFDAVIQKELKRAFHGATYNDAPFSGMIYTLEESLQCFRHHWNKVFSKCLPGSCLRVITELDEFLQNVGYVKDETDFVEFMKLCFSLCVYLKTGYRNSQTQMADCINKVKILADSS